MSQKRPGAQPDADINVRAVIGAAGIVVAAIVLAFILARGFLAGLGAGIHDAPRAPRELPPAPREQVHPVTDYRQYRAAELAKLANYGWVDRQAGIVEIPIERAMALVVGREETSAAAPNRGPR